MVRHGTWFASRHRLSAATRTIDRCFGASAATPPPPATGRRADTGLTSAWADWESLGLESGGENSSIFLNSKFGGDVLKKCTMKSVPIDSTAFEY